MAGRPKHYDLSSPAFAYAGLENYERPPTQPTTRPDYGSVDELPVFRIVLIGENRCGKTALASQFVNGGYILSEMPTTETEIYYHRIAAREDLPENPKLKDIMMEIRDVGGHWLMTDDEPNAKQFIKDADGLMFCVSMRDKTSCDRMKERHMWNWVRNLLENEQGDDPPMLLVGCQSDRARNVGGGDKDDVKSVAKKLGMNYVLTSASGGQTREPFYRLAHMIYEHKVLVRTGRMADSGSPVKGQCCICC